MRGSGPEKAKRVSKNGFGPPYREHDSPNCLPYTNLPSTLKLLHRDSPPAVGVSREALSIVVLL